MGRIFRVAVVAIIVAACASAGRGGDAADVTGVILPFVTRHCVGCHGVEEPAAGLALQGFTTDAAILAQHRSWTKVLEKVALWERKFQEAKTPEGRHWAMTQLRRWTTDDHPIIQLWLNRDPRFSDMTWTPLLEGS